MEPLKGGKLASFNKKISENFTNYAKDASIASWSFRWLGSLEGIKVILSGMNEEDQLVDNINIFKKFKRMNVEELELVEKVRMELKNSIKVGCTTCKYCMPCPFGVNIASNFKVYNTYAMYENKEELLNAINGLKDKGEYADSCKKCGVCLKKCPQGIDIPTKLSEFKLDMKRVLEK